MEDSDLEWEETPSYYDFIKGVMNVTHFVFYHPTSTAANSEPFWSFVWKNCVGLYGLSVILGLAVAFSWVREKLTKNFIQPLCQLYGLTERSQTKISESAWRMLFYTFIWTWEFYLAVIKYRFFQRPSTTFADQDRKIGVLWDIEQLYAVLIAFYLHATYTTLFVDVWRKDSKLLVFHHVLTLLMMVFSYTMKCTESGLLVLLTHDNSDIILEFSKINVCLKEGGKRKALFDRIAFVAFVLFSIAWFVSRLYFYPLKLIHTVSIAITDRQLYRLHFIYSSYLMALFLLIIDFYWTYLIVQLFVKIITGRMQNLGDPRDYNVEEFEKRHTAIQEENGIRVCRKLKSPEKKQK